MKLRSLLDGTKRLIHSFWKRKYVTGLCALLCGCSAFVLSGCTAVKDVIIQKAEIMTDEDYEKYVELRNTGQLNEDGYYMSEGIDIDLVEENVQEDVASQQGKIRITFAKNAYLDVEYYLDAKLEEPIESNICYLNPGECIYADVSPDYHSPSNWYKFDRFRVYAYDNNGQKGQELLWQEKGGENSQVIQIPVDYEGTEISVQPMGMYEEHSVYLDDYYTDSSGQKQELSGKWVVNDKEITDGTIEVSPTESLNVDYIYDPKEYSYVSSTPSSFYHENGLVRFEVVSAESDVEKYSVELRAIKGEFSFDPFEYPTEHGKVTFRYKDSVITERRGIPDGGVIDYEAEPDSGYRHPKGSGQVTVNASKPEDTEKEIKEAIKFYADELVEIVLTQPTNGGRIEYIANGEKLTGKTCKLHSGTEIAMNFFGWNGWICNQPDGSTYTVTEQKNQSVTIEGIDINSDVFVEDDRHKPVLYAVIEDSLQDAVFEISAAGVQSEELSYATGDKNTFLPDWMGQTDRLIFEDKIGTDKGITIGVRNSTILDGEALRLEIVTVDADDNKDETIQYITKLPMERKILLYDEEEIAESTTVYKEVKITASRTKVVPYEPKSIDNAVLQISLNDAVLEEGDVLETTREVEVVIAPSDGYIVTGSKTDNGIYSEIMKYSKWEKDWEKIVKNHPVKKLWHVTLDASDDYGDCVYKLDGEEVSGTIEVYEGQELILEYTLTHSDYEIDREKGIGNFVDGLIHKNKGKKSIKVSEELDGKTIRRSDYITIDKGEK